MEVLVIFKAGSNARVCTVLLTVSSAARLSRVQSRVDVSWRVCLSFFYSTPGV